MGWVWSLTAKRTAFQAVDLRLFRGEFTAPAAGVLLMRFRRVLPRAAARSNAGRCTGLRRSFLRCEQLEPRVLLAADVDSPVAALVDPVDNSVDDLNETTTIVHIDSITAPHKFEISLTDVDSGVDSESVQEERFSLFQNDREMAAGVDYVFSFDETASTVTLAGAAPFSLDAQYRLVIDNTPGTGVRDAVGNLLAANQVDGTTQFTLVYTDTVNDPPLILAPAIDEVHEDQVLVFSIDAGNGVSVSDADAFLGDNRLEIDIHVDHGDLTLAKRETLEFEVGDGEQDRSVRFIGTVTEINAALDGLRFSPDPDYEGTAEIELWSSDLGNFTGSQAIEATDYATITVSVVAINDPPTHTVPTSVETWEDTVLTLDAESGQQIKVNDVDVGDGQLTVTLTAESGTLTLNSEAEVVYRTGGPIDQEAVVFSGTLDAINEALESVIFEPASDFNESMGAARIVIISRDLGNTGTGGEQITVDEIPIAVHAVNDSPVNLVPPGLMLDEDGQVELALAAGTGIVVSDVDNDEGSGEVRIALTAEYGSLTLFESNDIHLETGDGVADRQLVMIGQLADVNLALDRMQFHPDRNYTGRATLEVTSMDVGTDGDVGTDRDVIELTVRAVNDPPELRFAAVQETDEDVPLVFSVESEDAVAIVDVDAGEGILAVDISSTGGVVDLVAVDGVEYLLGDGETDTHVVVSGTLRDLNAALTSLRFTPHPNWTGTATVSVEVDDGGYAGEGGAQITQSVLEVMVRPVNDPPEAVDDTLIVQRETPRTIEVVNNDTDLDGRVVPGTVEIVHAPAHGTAVVQSDGVVSYLPEPGFSGVDSFRYSVRDDQGLTSSPGVVTVIVNEPPTAIDDVLITDQNTSAEIEILANDSDPDGDLVPGSISIVSAPEHGSVAIDANGGVTYTPQPDYFGFDQFTYTVEDNRGAVSNAAVVAIAVEWVAPFQNPNQPYDVNNDGSVSAIDVLLIINLLNLNDEFPGPVPEPSAAPFVPPAYYDVNGDNHVTPSDAIEVTNYLNSRDQNPEGEAGQDHGSQLWFSEISGMSDRTFVPPCQLEPVSAPNKTERRASVMVLAESELRPARGAVAGEEGQPVALLSWQLRAVDTAHRDHIWLERLMLDLFREGDLWLQTEEVHACPPVGAKW